MTQLWLSWKGILPLACLSVCVCVCWGGCFLVGVYASGVVCRDVAGFSLFGHFFETLNGEC